MNYKKIGIFVLLFQSTVLFAHDPSCCDHTHRWWWNFGIGAGSASNDSHNFAGGAGQLSVNGMITDTLFTTLEWTNVVKDDNESAREVGLLLGYKSKRPNWFWTVAAGIGATRYEQQRTYQSYYYTYTYTYTYTETKTDFSVPVEAQLFYTPFKHFGVGLIGHASVSKNPFASAMLAIQFA